jgi:hypothetical protein
MITEDEDPIPEKKGMAGTQTEDPTSIHKRHLVNHLSITPPTPDLTAPVREAPLRQR